MGARFRLWWQQIVTILVFLIILVVVIAFIIVEIIANGTGFAGKTLWDWMQLLIIPVVLAVAALLFNLVSTRTEQRIAVERYEQDKEIAEKRYEQDQNLALDKQREDLLQVYLDRMSELLLDKQLRTSETHAEVRNVARVRTMTFLPRLDATRKSSVLLFLHESGLIDKGKYIIDLSGANLSGANLRTDNLSAAYLRNIYLDGANLREADLREADLRDAVLSGVHLNGADLSGANMRDAFGITSEQLEKQAKSLKGATMPDGSIHP